MSSFLGQFNMTYECRALKIRLWHCPPFLFLLMGIVTIVSMVVTYLIANQYFSEPEVVALVVSFIAALFFVIGNMVIKGFNAIVEANRTKSEFVSIISHQLGTPLSIFRMTLELAEREQKEGGSNISEHFQTLGDTVQRMIRLVHSLLEVNKIEAARLTLRPQALALEALTKRLVEDFRRYADAHKVPLLFTAPDSLPRALGDPEKIEMVMQNLIDNAIRYTIGGGSIAISISADEYAVRWSIKDQGIGISSAQRPYIFQKFFRGGVAGQRDTHGSGIGLYIARAIVEASGGKIGLDSEEKKGSTFWFTLPLATKTPNS